MPTSLEKLECLVCAVPDPSADRDALLELRDSTSAVAQGFAERLHTEGEWRSFPLRELLPGLSLITAPNFSIRLSVRAANPILRVGAGTLKALAGMTPAAILSLPHIGKKTAEEILAAAVSEWAAAYLDQGEEDRVQPPLGEGVAPPIQNVERRQHDLADAFARIEQAVGFEAFRRRQLDSASSPTQSEVGIDLRISSERVAHYERTIREMLSKQMRSKQSPLSIAALDLQDRLGALARPQDLKEALAAIDPAKRTMPESMPHRRALLLWLAGFRLSADWVVDIEIEGIVDALLRGLTECGPTDLDVIERQLARLGVREDLRLPWIVSQPGLRVVGQELTRVDEGE